MEISSRHTGLAAASVNHMTALGPMPHKGTDLLRQNTESYLGANGSLSPRSAVGKIYSSDSPNTYGAGTAPKDNDMGLSEVSRGGKHLIHSHRNDSNDIERMNGGAGSSSSRMMEEWRDRDSEMNGRSNMIMRGNGEGQRERSRESRETSIEREKTAAKERTGENRSRYHRVSEQEREWEREEFREEGKERDRRERQREKDEADNFQSPRYALHTPPRRSGSLTGSASKISSITKRYLPHFFFIAIINRHSGIKFIC